MLPGEQFQVRDHLAQSVSITTSQSSSVYNQLSSSLNRNCVLTMCIVSYGISVTAKLCFINIHNQTPVVVDLLTRLPPALRLATYYAMG